MHPRPCLASCLRTPKQMCLSDHKQVRSQNKCICENLNIPLFSPKGNEHLSSVMSSPACKWRRPPNPSFSSILFPSNPHLQDKYRSHILIQITSDDLLSSDRQTNIAANGSGWWPTWCQYCRPTLQTRQKHKQIVDINTTGNQYVCPGTELIQCVPG